MEEQLKKSKKSSKNKYRIVIVLLGFAVLIGAVLLVQHLTAPDKPDTQQTTPSTAVVRITDNGFEPTTISVKSGTKVTWINTTQALHQIASNPYPQNDDLPSLKSEILNHDQSYSYVAKTTGTFNYHDQLRPTVNGTLVVEKR
jgi:plastocyanin